MGDRRDDDAQDAPRPGGALGPRTPAPDVAAREEAGAAAGAVGDAVEAEPGAAVEEGDAGDDGYALTRARVREVRIAVEAGAPEALGEMLEGLHPADVADLLEQLDEAARRALLALWGGEMDGEVLSELDPAIRRDLIEALPDAVLGEAVRDLDSDDVVDLVEDLAADAQDRLLDALPAPRRAAIRQALSYPEYSAGRLMQREVVRAPEHWRVGDAIDHLRGAEEHLPEQFYHVILVDPAARPVGYVTLSRIIASPRDTALRDLTEPSFRTVPVDRAEGEVAYAFNQYHLITLPVVDAQERLVGAITIDDAMAVLDEEAEEDILRLAGVGEDSSISDGVAETVRQRLPWLAVNLATAILASLVIGLFDEALAQVVALAILMPIVASMGGNAGTQSLTVAVRAMATKNLTPANMWRVVRRECAVGALNGVAFAVVMGVIAVLWFSDPRLGLVMACAMVVNLVVAALAGILVPLAMERAGVDPALASGTFVTTVTDVVGFFAFLGLGVLVLL